MSHRIPGDGPIGSIVLAALFAIAAIAFALRAWAAWDSGARTEFVVIVLATAGAVSLSVRSFRRARRVGYEARLER